MGIQGLTKFISPQFKSFTWNKTSTNVIVDGKSFLYHFLYNLDWRKGGDNKTFVSLLHTFFKNVPSHITFYVLIDGGNQDYKSTTLEKRRLSRFKVIQSALTEYDKNPNAKCPGKSIRTPMMMDLFIQIVGKYKHHIHFINGEADFALQSYASQYNAYVLSDDSDALLIQSRGTIKFDGFNKLKVIRNEDVLKSLRLKTNKELRAFASLLGNDITKNHNTNQVSSFIQKTKKHGHYFFQLSEYVASKNGNINELIAGIPNLKKPELFIEGDKLYTKTCVRNTNKLLSYAEQGQCSEFLIQAMDQQKMFYSILPEHQDQTSAWLRTRILRKLIYGKFSIPYVDEYGLSYYTQSEQKICHFEDNWLEKGFIYDPNPPNEEDIPNRVYSLTFKSNIHEMLEQDPESNIEELIFAFIKPYISDEYMNYLKTGEKIKEYKIIMTHYETLYQLTWCHMRTLLFEC